MGFDTIIRNGTLVTATDTYTADVAISHGKVAAIGSDLPVQNAGKMIDAKGKLVLPGGIDVHTQAHEAPRSLRRRCFKAGSSQELTRQSSLCSQSSI